jgi:hypothetical protein
MRPDRRLLCGERFCMSDTGVPSVTERRGAEMVPLRDR